jgi:hypothetical protein
MGMTPDDYDYILVAAKLAEFNKASICKGC